MGEIKKILVVVDPTVERDFVIERAKLVAKAAGASIDLFINNSNTLDEHSFQYEGIDGSFFETQKKLFKDHYEHILQRLQEELAEDGIEVSLEFTEEHNLAESIIKQAGKLGSDLVMKSTHHHSVIERSIITNTDWRLIRKCPAPLLLVKPREWQADGTIATAVDPTHIKAQKSGLDRKLVQSANELAQLLGQKWSVFHSYFPFVSTLFPMGGESEEYIESIGEQHRDKLQELIKDYSIAEEDVHLVRGEVVPNLIKFLETNNANVLVVGALSRNVVERAIVGNTAEKILENCPCDILVIKPAK